jgi:hypothetical protein
MTVYDAQIASARSAIERKGGLATWRKFSVTAGTHDWNEGSGTTPFTDYQVRVVVLPYDLESASTLIIDGAVRRLTNYALLAAQDFVPDIRDLLITALGEYKPVKIDVLAPDFAPILYTIGLEG